MRIVLIIGLVAQALSAQALSAQTTEQARAAVERALPLMQRSAREFVSRRGCVSCHHNILPVLTLHLARRRGFGIDATVLAAVEDKTFRELRSSAALDTAIQASTINDPTPDDSYLLMAAHDAGFGPDLATAVYARRLVRWQRDGHWVTSDFRPPHASSLFMTTATAVRAIRLYMPEELEGERDDALRRAEQWLAANRPVSTEDAAFRLLGLVWAGSTRNRIVAAARDVTAMQKPGGGWGQLPAYEADAYSTGEALFALHEAGTAPSDAAWEKGLRFLISSQAPDGSWHVHTRMLSPADVSPMYFPTGFPYEKDEFLSYAGTCWAVMALLSGMPDVSDPHESAATAAAVGPPDWMRPALFGTSRGLAALLDSGLDPNSRSANGTTLLMASAVDPEKVRLLLARGAEPKARAGSEGSGVDALTVAAAYRGTASSLRALLDAGVDAQPLDGARVKNEPLVLAAMSGDLDNVKLLLERGADPTARALSEAVTFGYPQVVRALLAFGGDATLVEGTGINLLHWAAITDRPLLIPVLARAGVPLNAKDENGFTPLMYAATIDFGDTAVLTALLKAGADRRIANPAGRIPLAQAHYLGHSDLEAALR